MGKGKWGYTKCLSPFLKYYPNASCIQGPSESGQHYLNIQVVNDYDKNRSYVPLETWRDPSLFPCLFFTHLDLSGLQQLNDSVFGVFHYSNIKLNNLESLQCSGCNYLTDTGLESLFNKRMNDKRLQFVQLARDQTGSRWEF